MCPASQCRVYLGGDFHKLRQGVIEELLVSRAEETNAAEILGAENGPVLQATSPADGKVSANETLIGKFLLCPGENTFSLVSCKPLYRRIDYVACSPPRLDEKIAAENIAGMLDNNILTASFTERADRMFAGDVIGQNGIEIAYAQFCGAEFVPAVECSAQKIAVLFRRDGKIRDISRRSIELDARDELQELYAEADEKIEYLVGMFDVFGIQQSEGIQFDMILFALFNCPDNFIECPFAGVVEAIVIVEFFRAVDTNTEKKFVIVQEPAPLLVDKDGVCLHGVADLLAGAAVLLLQLHGLTIEIEPHKHRLAPLPCEACNREIQLHVIFDELFQHFVAHALSAPAELGRPAFVEAVPAIEIAVRSGRFYKETKWPHQLCSILCLSSHFIAHCSACCGVFNVPSSWAIYNSSAN
jgi:hypothetical protein